MKVYKKWYLLGFLVLCTLVLADSVDRRTALLAEAQKSNPSIKIIASGISDTNVMVRRTAVRILADIGEPARTALEKAFTDSDVIVRRTALGGLLRLPELDLFPYMDSAVKDENVLLRLFAVQYLVANRPLSPAMYALLEEAAKDKNDKIRKLAIQSTWPFRCKTIPIRERKDLDRDVVVSQVIPLPKGGWKFCLDPNGDGHHKGWYKPTLDDSGWGEISIEQAWQKAGYDYTGVAWYRRTIELPAKPDCLAVELHFAGVDECAWVWVNGKYVGEHDVGPVGWNIPFNLDVTKEVNWGKANQITIRAMNTAMAGGIWAPVNIEILK
jgi:hypothetical protein